MGHKVTDTREISRMTQAGSVVQTYRVWLVTDKGSSGTVDVPKDKWNAEDLPEILAAKAAELDLAFVVTE
jgi:hypothetical protein